MSNERASPPLPNDVAPRVADFAGVPHENHDSFCKLLDDAVQRVWYRARPVKPGAALVRAAEAARTLYEAVGSLNKEDREWVRRLQAEHSVTDTNVWLPDTALLLVHLFSFAVGKAPPQDRDTAARPELRGRRRGTVKNVIFRDFVFDLLSTAGASGGDFTFDKNYETGTLLKAIEILSPQLPEGVIPKPLSKSMGTIQRIVIQYRKAEGQVRIDNLS
jgi:hypothetical protein